MRVFKKPILQLFVVRCAVQFKLARLIWSWNKDNLAMAVVGVAFIIFQILTFFIVDNECRINELYRWKQISFEKLGLGKDIILFVLAFSKTKFSFYSLSFVWENDIAGDTHSLNKFKIS